MSPFLPKNTHFFFFFFCSDYLYFGELFKAKHIKHNPEITEAHRDTDFVNCNPILTLQCSDHRV